MALMGDVRPYRQIDTVVRVVDIEIVDNESTL